MSLCRGVPVVGRKLYLLGLLGCFPVVFGAVFLCCLRCEQPRAASTEKESPGSINPPPLLPCAGHLHIPPREIRIPQTS